MMLSDQRHGFPHLAALPAELLLHIAECCDLPTLLQLSQTSKRVRSIVYTPASFQALIENAIARSYEFYEGRGWSRHMLQTCAGTDMRRWAHLAAFSDQEILIERVKSIRLNESKRDAPWCQYRWHDQRSKDLALKYLELQQWVGELAVLEHPIIDLIPWIRVLGPGIHCSSVSGPAAFALMRKRSCRESLLFALIVGKLRALQRYPNATLAQRNDFERWWSYQEWAAVSYPDAQSSIRIVYEVMSLVLVDALSRNLELQSTMFPRIEQLHFEPITGSRSPCALPVPSKSHSAWSDLTPVPWQTWIIDHPLAMLDSNFLFETHWEGYIRCELGRNKGYQSDIQFCRRELQDDACDNSYWKDRERQWAFRRTDGACGPPRQSTISASYCKDGLPVKHAGVLEAPDDVMLVTKFFFHDVGIDGNAEHWHCELTVLGIVGVVSRMTERNDYEDLGYIWLWRSRSIDAVK